MSGIDQALSGQIFSLATTRGNYTPNNMLYIGTSQGKIFRLKDPGNADPSTAPVSIGPSFMPGSVLVKDIAMHIAAMRPQALTKDDLDPALIDKEREILAEASRIPVLEQDPRTINRLRC